MRVSCASLNKGQRERRRAPLGGLPGQRRFRPYPLAVHPAAQTQSAPRLAAQSQSVAPCHLADDLVVYQGDALETLSAFPSESVNCCVTSVPYYGQRDYGVAGQQGREATVEAYVAGMVAVFEQVRRVLAKDGTCWLNIGDTLNNRTRVRTSGSQGINGVDDRETWQHAARRNGVRMSTGRGGSLKEKDLMLIPARLSLALQAHGWWVRSDIAWVKPVARDSAPDRPARSWEHVLLLTRSSRYWFDLDALTEPARGSGFHRKGRDVWNITPSSGVQGHGAPMPAELAERCIRAGCPPGGLVLDPYLGSGTTALAARRHGRQAVGVELSAASVRLAIERLVHQA